MSKLPRAILFDLDDTILVAFGPAESQWQRVLGGYVDHLAPLTPAAAIAAIMDSSRDLWADPARHKHWRHRIGEARRRIVADGFAALAAGGQTVPERALCDEIADRFNALHDAELRVLSRRARHPRPLEGAGRAPGADHQRRRRAAARQGGAVRARAPLRPHPDRGRARFWQTRGARLHPCDGGASASTARETWMVGDNLEWEVAAPQRLGIHAIWHDGYGTGLPPDCPVRPDRIIRRLSELLP